MTISKGCVFRACSSARKRIGHPPLGLAGTQKQAGAWRGSIGRKGRLLVCPAWRVSALGKLQVG